MAILKPSFYKQSDSRWTKKTYRCTDGGFASIGCAGCGETAVANVINALIKPITPVPIFKYACKEGYMTSNSGTYRSAIPKLLKHYGIHIVDTVPRSSEGKLKLRNYLRSNHWAIAIMGKGIWTNGGHYILAYYVDSDGYVYISDSASSAEYRQKNTFENFWNQQKDVSWLIVNPRQYVRQSTKDKSKTITSITLYTNNSKANVRKLRTTASKIAATLPRNKALKVYDLKNGWWRIASGRYAGFYINESNLSKYKTTKKIYRTNFVMNIREGYSTSSEIIGKVEKGRAIESSKQKGNWAYIPAKKGWICIRDSEHTYLKEV